MTPLDRRRCIRSCVVIFIVGMLPPGLTAFPLEHELDILATIIGTPAGGVLDGLQRRIAFVRLSNALPIEIRFRSARPAAPTNNISREFRSRK